MKTPREKVIEELNGKKHLSWLSIVGAIVVGVITVAIVVIHHYREAIDSQSHMVEVFFLMICLFVFGWWALVGRKR